MSNNEETGPSDQDADEMDYEGEQEYVDYLTAKQGQGLQVGLDDGTDADIDTNGVGTDGGAESAGEGTSRENTGGEGTGADASTLSFLCCSSIFCYISLYILFMKMHL